MSGAKKHMKSYFFSRRNIFLLEDAGYSNTRNSRLTIPIRPSNVDSELLFIARTKTFGTAQSTAQLNFKLEMFKMFKMLKGETVLMICRKSQMNANIRTKFLFETNFSIQ